MTALTTWRGKYGRLLALAFITFIILLGIAFMLRMMDHAEPLELIELDEFGVDAELLGIAMQQLFVPLTGLLLLSLTPFFRSAISPQTQTKREQFWLNSFLITILLINLIATVWLSEDIDFGLTNGLLIVLVSAILGGWRMGLRFGLITVLFFMINHFTLDQGIESGEQVISVLATVLLDLSVIILLFSGVLVGFWKETDSNSLLLPSRLFLLGFLIEWSSAWLFFVAFGTAEFLVEELPGAILNGLALFLFGLLIQQAQGRETEIQLANAENAQTQAELRALRAQINPHFLFNALSTIRYHARTAPDTAYDLLDDLSDVFHSVLRSEATVTLEAELETVKAYLAIEKARLGDRLTVNWQIHDCVNQAVHLPTLIVQPIAENAIVHGIAPKATGGTLTITATQQNGYTQIEVTDDGCGFDPQHNQPKGHGIGLNNIEQRMTAIYGASYKPVIQSQPEKGTTVTLKIPA